jgi:hypothetical protein
MEILLLGIIIGLLLAIFCYFGSRKVTPIAERKIKQLTAKQAIIIETQSPLEKLEAQIKKENDVELTTKPLPDRFDPENNFIYKNE